MNNDVTQSNPWSMWRVLLFFGKFSHCRLNCCFSASKRVSFNIKLKTKHAELSFSTFNFNQPTKVNSDVLNFFVSSHCAKNHRLFITEKHLKRAKNSQFTSIYLWNARAAKHRMLEKEREGTKERAERKLRSEEKNVFQSFYWSYETATSVTLLVSLCIQTLLCARCVYCCCCWIKKKFCIKSSSWYRLLIVFIIFFCTIRVQSSAVSWILSLQHQYKYTNAARAPQLFVPL